MSDLASHATNYEARMAACADQAYDDLVCRIAAIPTDRSEYADAVWNELRAPKLSKGLGEGTP